MSDMFHKGSTVLDDGSEVTCNWCGKRVKAFFARYLSGKGLFYHQDCYKEREARKNA
jgi:hypothetical protein